MSSSWEQVVKRHCLLGGGSVLLILGQGVVPTEVARSSHRSIPAVPLRVVHDNLQVSDHSVKGASEYR